MSVLSVKNLTVKYDHVLALDNVSFDVKRHEFFGIIGPNGGGKTTLVKTLLGLVDKTSGDITLSPNETIGYVPQITTFDKGFPISVLEVILGGHLPRKIKFAHRFGKEEHEHAIRLMTQLRIDHLSNRQIGQLSGGQMQRVLIARALMNHPTILILDEPTASVDEKTKQEIYDMLKELSQTITIIMISHDTNFIWKYLNRVVYINKVAHIHNYSNATTVVIDENNNCPIDWFVQGEKIQMKLMNEKEQCHDRSDN